MGSAEQEIARGVPAHPPAHPTVPLTDDGKSTARFVSQVAIEISGFLSARLSSCLVPSLVPCNPLIVLKYPSSSVHIVISSSSSNSMTVACSFVSDFN